MFKMPCRDIKALKPIAQEACKLFLEECKKQGLNVIVTQTWRTAEYQNSLYQQGRTKPGNIVTGCDGYKSKSNHQSGLAWDICHNKKGDEYNKQVLAKAGAIGKKLGIEWGGGWTIGDTPHFQVTETWVAPIKEDVTYKKAIQNFVLEGMVGSPAAWLPKANLKNVDALITKMGIRLFNLSDYNKIIDRMVGEGIINSPGIWKSKTYTEQNVGDLIIKVSNYLG